MTSIQTSEVLRIKLEREALRKLIKAGDRSIEVRKRLAELPTVEDLAEKFGTSTQAICRARIAA
jgi:hypothetical protein